MPGRQVLSLAETTLVTVALVTVTIVAGPQAATGEVQPKVYRVLGSGGLSGESLYSMLATGYGYSQNTAYVQYSTTDSEAGLECYFVQGQCDFANIDYPLDADTQAALSNGTWQAEHSSGGKVSRGDGNQYYTPGSAVLQLPVAVVPYVFGYRIDGLSGTLVLSGEAVGQVLMGNATTWDHPVFTSLNPGLASVAAGLPVVLSYHDSAYGLAPLLGDTLAVLDDAFAAWREGQVANGTAALPGGAPGWMRPATELGTAVGHATIGLMLGNVSATNGALTFLPLESAVSRAMAVASMVNPAGLVVAPSGDATAYAVSDFGTAISATPRDLMHTLLLAGATKDSSWPMCAFALAIVSANITADNCYYVNYMLDFFGFGQVNQQASNDLIAAAYALVPPLFSKNVIDLLGTIQCNDERAFSRAFIVGSGSPNPAYSVWAFNYATGNVSVNYVATKGHDGKTQIMAGDTDFGMTNSANKLVGDDLALVPVIAYPIVVCYNVPEINDQASALALDMATLEAMLVANITRWDDDALVALNPNLTLPAHDILFTNKVGKSIYTGTIAAAFGLADPAFESTYGSGDGVLWPAQSTSRFVPANSSADQVLKVKSTAYSFTYTAHHVALQDRNLREAHMLNTDRSAVLPPNQETTLAALGEVASRQAGGLSSLDRLTYVVGAVGPRAWPFSTLGLFVFHTRTMPDAFKASQLLKWIYWTQASTQGQRLAAATGSYGMYAVPDVWSQVLTALVNVTVKGVHVNSLYPCFSNGTLCSGAGTCDETKGVCLCDDGRAGQYCESAASDSGGSSSGLVYEIVLVPVLVVALAACLIVALLLVALAFWRSRAQAPEEWEISIDEIEYDPNVVSLGAGGYGEVKRAHWRGSEVAVKTLRLDAKQTTKDALRKFKEEVRVMTALRHPNVVLFMAACTTPPDLCIVMEYMTLGSLCDLLHNELIPDLPAALQIKMAYQAAKGMHFLHSSGMVHRDLKSPNLLLNSKWEVKVSDFGLTKFKGEISSPGGAGTVEGSIHWMAPEVLAMATEVNYMAADTYSFGIVLWEIITRGSPYGEMPPAAIAVGVLRNGMRPQVTEADAQHPLYALMDECWLEDPVMRPDFKSITDRLHVMMAVEQPGDRTQSSSSSSTMGGVYSSHHHPASKSSLPWNVSSSSAASHGRQSSVSADSEVGSSSGARRASSSSRAIGVSDLCWAAALWDVATQDKKHADAICDAMTLHNQILRTEARKVGGVETPCSEAEAAACTGADGTLCFVFDHTVEALSWCASVQRALAAAAWPVEIRDIMATISEKAGAPPDLIDRDSTDGDGDDGDDDGVSGARSAPRVPPYAGLRVRMAVHFGKTRIAGASNRIGRPTCSGPAVRQCCWLTTLASAGRVLVSRDARAQYRSSTSGGKTKNKQQPLNLVQVVLPQAYCDREQSQEDGASENEGSDIDDKDSQTKGQIAYELLVANYDGAAGQEAAMATGELSIYGSQRGASKRPVRRALLPYEEHDRLGSVNACTWIIPYKDLEEMELVGMGSCGSVFHGRWKGTDVAIKKLAKQHVDERTILELRAEAGMLNSLSHPNVVQLIGVCLTTLCIVTEFMPRGSVRSVLDAQGSRLSWPQRLTMMLTAARGLRYLHRLRPPIVHRDIKSNNLLVADDYSVKVADFGFARIKADNATMTRCGTPCWTAPEVLRGERYTEKIDVYSFGIVMWEVLSGSKPYANRRFDQVLDDVLENRRPSIPSDCPRPLAALIASCWHHKASKRPSMSDVVRCLKSLHAHSGTSKFHHHHPDLGEEENDSDVDIEMGPL